MPCIERQITSLTHKLEQHDLERKHQQQLAAIDTDRKIYGLSGHIGKSHQNMGKWELLSGAVGFAGALTSVGLKVAFDGKYANNDKIVDTAAGLFKAMSSYFQQTEQKEMTITQNSVRQQQEQHTDQTRKATDNHHQQKMEQLRETIHRAEAKKSLS